MPEDTEGTVDIGEEQEMMKQGIEAADMTEVTSGKELNSSIATLFHSTPFCQRLPQLLRKERQ